MVNKGVLIGSCNHGFGGIWGKCEESRSKKCVRIPKLGAQRGGSPDRERGRSLDHFYSNLSRKGITRVNLQHQG